MYSTLLAVNDGNDLIHAREAGRTAARELGAGPSGETMAATVVSELVRNLLQHAGGGEVRITARSNSLAIETLDRGPGIDDAKLALSRGYSTAGGAGLGLPAVQLVADSLEFVERVPNGLAVRVVVPASRLSPTRPASQRQALPHDCARHAATCEKATRRRVDGHA